MFVATIHGRLTGDPQLEENRCTFTVAAETSYRDRTTNEYATEFVRVTIWGKQAETAATYLHKADKVIVNGDYHTEVFVGRDGAQHTTQQLRANAFEFGERRRNVQQDDDDVLPD